MPPALPAVLDEGDEICWRLARLDINGFMLIEPGGFPAVVAGDCGVAAEEGGDVVSDDGACRGGML